MEMFATLDKTEQNVGHIGGLKLTVAKTDIKSD
jgi:hypothetical protein